MNHEYIEAIDRLGKIAGVMSAATSPNRTNPANSRLRTGDGSTFVWGLVLACVMTVAGASITSAGATEPVPLQLRKNVPFLSDSRFIALLTFENGDDAVFVRSDGGTLDDSKAHTGSESFRLGRGMKAIVRLEPLTAAASFPGTWRLVGGFVYAERECTVVLTLSLGNGDTIRQEVAHPGGAWRMAMVDLNEMKSAQRATELTVEVTGDAGNVWLDDIMLVDNDRFLLGREGDSFTVRRSGLRYLGNGPMFNFRFLTEHASPVGWKLNASEVSRVRFSSTGKEKSLTVYSDGRAYWDGEFKPLVRADWVDAVSKHHQSPAELTVSDEQGRVNRTSTGDANNDGYNELLGSYQLVASTPRMDIQIRPVAPVVKPTFEITGLPAGKVVATLEGKLIEDVHRLSDGRVLIEIPVKIERAVQLSVRVQ